MKKDFDYNSAVDMILKLLDSDHFIKMITALELDSSDYGKFYYNYSTLVYDSMKQFKEMLNSNEMFEEQKIEEIKKFMNSKVWTYAKKLGEMRSIYDPRYYIMEENDIKHSAADSEYKKERLEKLNKERFDATLEASRLAWKNGLGYANTNSINTMEALLRYSVGMSPIVPEFPDIKEWPLNPEIQEMFADKESTPVR